MMSPESLQQQFWGAPLPLPRGVKLLRQDSLVLPQRGPRGIAIYDLVQLQLPEGLVSALLAYRAPLFPADLPRLKARLQEVDELLRRRESTGRTLPLRRALMVATNVASPGLIEACEQEEVALVDLRGTLVLRHGPTFIRVQGQGKFRKPSRAPLFHGKGCRLVRIFLETPGERWTVRQLEQKAETGYAYAHAVVTQLEQAGYLERSSPRSGFRVRDPARLLQAWLDSGRPTAATFEAFNAPSTTAETLRRGFDALSAEGIRSIFTLASGLKPEERYASGLPHGMYLSGSLEPVIQAFGLRRITPHNFLVMRPEAAAETEAGGIYFAPRLLPHGPSVALSQLTVDFHHSAGRGKEQAEALLELYAKSLPLLPEPTDG